jgi:hypothetical protein
MTLIRLHIPCSIVRLRGLGGARVPFEHYALILKKFKALLKALPVTLQLLLCYLSVFLNFANQHLVGLFSGLLSQQISALVQCRVAN